MVTCPICGTTPATTQWHGVTICTDCHEWQQVVDQRINWVIVGALFLVVIMIIIIAR